MIQKKLTTASSYSEFENSMSVGQRDPILIQDYLLYVDMTRLIDNIVNLTNGITGAKKEEIICRQLYHFFRVDMNLSVAIAKGLGIEIDESIMSKKC